MGNACQQLNHKPLASHFIPKNTIEDISSSFCIVVELGFFIKGKTNISEKGAWTMLELMGMSDWRAAGLQGCIPCRNCERIKLNI
jgi:hypothetical protein